MTASRNTEPIRGESDEARGSSDDSHHCDGCPRPERESGPANADQESECRCHHQSLHEHQHHSGLVGAVKQVRTDIVQEAVVDPDPVGRCITEWIGAGSVFAGQQALPSREMKPDIRVLCDERSDEKGERDCQRRQKEIRAGEPCRPRQCFRGLREWGSQSAKRAPSKLNSHPGRRTGLGLFRWGRRGRGSGQLHDNLWLTANGAIPRHARCSIHYGQAASRSSVDGTPRARATPLATSACHQHRNAVQFGLSRIPQARTHRRKPP